MSPASVERQQNVRHESSDGSLGGPEGSVGRLPVWQQLVELMEEILSSPGGGAMV